MRNGLNSLLQTKVNFKGVNVPVSGLVKLARPFMGKVAPMVESITGVTVDELLGELNSQAPHNVYTERSVGNIHNKYKGL